MKTKYSKSVVIMVIAFVFSIIGTINAQETIPEWITKLPIKKGFVYGAGEGISDDLPSAIDKAKIIAVTDLTKNYLRKFELFANKCDTILGADNSVTQMIITIKSNQSATLYGVEKADQVVNTNDSLVVVYILLKLDISSSVKMLKQEVESDAKLRKKMNKEGLLKELNEM